MPGDCRSGVDLHLSPITSHGCRCGTLLFALLLLSAGAAAAAEDGPRSVDFAFEPHGIIRWDRGQHPVLGIYPRGGDGWITIAQRYAGGASDVTALRRANPRLRSPMRDRRVRIPVEILRADIRLKAVKRLFPVDVRTVLGWRHMVLDPFHGGEESWEWLAELFTGRRDRASALAGANPSGGADDPRRGKPILVPESLLLPVFDAVPPVATPTPRASATPMPRPTVGPPRLAVRTTSPLQYGVDELGEYGVYRLQKGEALYSAVVVRFTGQLLAKQVNEMAQEIAARSGIDDAPTFQSATRSRSRSISCSPSTYLRAAPGVSPGSRSNASSVISWRWSTPQIFPGFRSFSTPATGARTAARR